MRPFKRGSFVLALQARRARWCPCRWSGVKRVAPRGILTLRPGTVRLEIHSPIATAGLEAGAAESLAGAGAPGGGGRLRGGGVRATRAVVRTTEPW